MWDLNLYRLLEFSIILGDIKIILASLKKIHSTCLKNMISVFWKKSCTVNLKLQMSQSKPSSPPFLLRDGDMLVFYTFSILLLLSLRPPILLVFFGLPNYEDLLGIWCLVSLRYLYDSRYLPLHFHCITLVLPKCSRF